jgi:hypothetical protein
MAMIPLDLPLDPYMLFPGVVRLEKYLLRALPAVHDDIRQEMSALLSSGAFADVDLFVSDGRKAASAHQAVLAAISPVMKGILQEMPYKLHSLMIGAPPIAILLPNVEAHVVEALISLIYTGECKLPDVAPFNELIRNLGITLNKLMIDVEENNPVAAANKSEEATKRKSSLNTVQKAQNSTKGKSAKKTSAKKPVVNSAVSDPPTPISSRPSKPTVPKKILPSPVAKAADSTTPVLTTDQSNKRQTPRILPFAMATNPAHVEDRPNKRKVKSMSPKVLPSLTVADSSLPAPIEDRLRKRQRKSMVSKIPPSTTVAAVPTPAPVEGPPNKRQRRSAALAAQAALEFPSSSAPPAKRSAPAVRDVGEAVEEKKVKPSVKCLRCETEFTRSQAFKEHMVTHYREDILKKFQLDSATICSFCSGTFKGAAAMARHVGVTHHKLEEFLDKDELKEYR